MQADTSALAGRLANLGYAGLFQNVHTHDLDALWNEAGVPNTLAALAADRHAPMGARFLAAEILRRKSRSASPDEARPELAGVYATALAENTTGTANAWGLPGLFDGALAQHLIAFGDAAVPALVPLLDDARRVHYAGSQEATFANAHAYRVKDVAAWYLGRIAHRPVDLVGDPPQRDAAIEALKRSFK